MPPVSVVVPLLGGVDRAHYRLHQENMRKGYSRLRSPPASELPARPGPVRSDPVLRGCRAGWAAIRVLPFGGGTSGCIGEYLQYSRRSSG